MLLPELLVTPDKWWAAFLAETNMKLPVHRAGLRGKETLYCTLSPANPALAVRGTGGRSSLRQNDLYCLRWSQYESHSPRTGDDGDCALR
jgi:hypothetical protein